VRVAEQDKAKCVCMFCGNSIEETPVDPCAGLFVAAWSENAFEERAGQYWFHAACVQQHAHPSIPLYFLDLADGA
jgi:hypothetical protein